LNPIVAIDLGNSEAKWAVDDQTDHRVSLRTSDWLDRLISGSIEALGAENASHAHWRIASVNRPVAKSLVGRLQDEFAANLKSSVSTITCADVPMIARVANPDRVGIDRLLAGWMATQLYPNRDVIVVDAGSAITVDFVSRRAEFMGGVILPGIALQFDSLARGTDALPAIELPSASSVDRHSLANPATDTVSAIRSGILLGTAAAIDGLILDQRERSDAKEAAVLFTGGDASLLSRLSMSEHLVMPRLVLDAIRSLPSS
jgi:type III pantothenate kinase